MRFLKPMDAHPKAGVRSQPRGISQNFSAFEKGRSRKNLADTVDGVRGATPS